MTQPLIQVFDATGKLVASETARSKAARISVRAAQWQGQLDKMAAALNGRAATGTIGKTAFSFAKGFSQWVAR